MLLTKFLRTIVPILPIKDYFPEYVITFGYEKKEILEKLERDAAELQRGIDLKNPGVVGHIAKDKMFFNEYSQNWLCNSTQCSTMSGSFGNEPP